jgi:hypothetical protein
MSRLLAYWMAAALLAVGLVEVHLFGGTWVTRRFPELNRSITDPTPLSFGAQLVMLGSLALAMGGAVAVPLLIYAGLSARDQQRWAAQRRQWEAARAAERAHWAREQQGRGRLREIRDQLYLESLPAPERERLLARRRREQALDARAQAILAAERRGEADGR